MWQVTLIAAFDCVYRVEDRDVHNGHGAGGPARSKLFTENAVFTGKDRGVVKACGNERDLIPTTDWVETEIGSAMVISNVRVVFSWECQVN